MSYQAKSLAEKEADILHGNLSYFKGGAMRFADLSTLGYKQARDLGFAEKQSFLNLGLFVDGFGGKELTSLVDQMNLFHGAKNALNPLADADAGKIWTPSTYEVACAANKFVYRAYVAVDKSLYTITNGVSQATTSVGANQTSIVFTMTGTDIRVDDVLMLSDSKTLVIVRIIEKNGMTTKVTVTTLEPYAAGIQSSLLATNRELRKMHNVKPTRSSHGSETRVASAAYAEGYFTTMRFQHGVDGDTYASQAFGASIDPNQAAFPVLFRDSKGEIVRTVVTAQQQETMRELRRCVTNWEWIGKKYVDTRGVFQTDVRGEQYITGMGILDHLSNSLKFSPPIQGININLYESIGLALSDLNGVGSNLVLHVFAGIQHRKALALDIAKRFKGMANSANVFFDTELYKKTGQVKTMEKNSGRGYNEAFDTYKFAIGFTLVIHPCNYFDAIGNFANNRAADGAKLASYSAVVLATDENGNALNIGNGNNGSPIYRVKRAGRPTVVTGTLHGMANPQNNAIATPVDETETHYLLQTGIAVPNPYAMAFVSVPSV